MRSFGTKRTAADEWALALAMDAPPNATARALTGPVARPCTEPLDASVRAEPPAEEIAANKRCASAAAWRAILSGRGTQGHASNAVISRPQHSVLGDNTLVQRLLAPVRPIVCSQCGMLYTRGDPVDEEAHARHHKAQTSCNLIFRPDANEDVVERGSTATSEPWRIVRLDCADSSRVAAGRRARISELLERELGCDARALSTSSARLVIFALVGAGHRLRGCVVAEHIDGGWELEAATDEASGSEALPGSAAGARTAKVAGGTANGKARDGSLCCSTVRVPAECGVRYVWVNRSHRRMGIARALVEALRAHLLQGRCIAREHVAFSQPTNDGHAFALRYAGTPRFTVYVPLD